MNAVTLLFGILLCMAVVSCRHYSDRADIADSLDDTDHIGKARDLAANQMRHRRRRWQSNYGYDYAPPQMPYYPDRREYDRPNQQQEIIPQILRLLDEISNYVKRPPPPMPPQPIYIPYPVPYPVPQQCVCQTKNTKDTNTSDFTPDVGKRQGPFVEDDRQNWGLVQTTKDAEYDDFGDGSRSISFDPIKPKRPITRPAPKVEHGSSQAESDLQTQATKSADFDFESGRNAVPCNGAILSCCSSQQQKACFTKHGCGMTFAKGNACSADSISAALDSFKTAYAPVY